MDAPLLVEQNELAYAHGPSCRFLKYRCAALTREYEDSRRPNVRSGSHQHKDSALAPRHAARSSSSRSATRPGDDFDANRSSSYATDMHHESSSRLSSSPQRAAIDVEAIALKPPGHQEPNFAAAEFDGDIPANDTRIAAVVEKVDCTICGRSFAKDRIAAHVKACKKAAEAAKKRGSFDVRQHRLQTVLDENQADPHLELKILEGAVADDAKPKKASWRQQSAQFQRAMRASKTAAPMEVEVEDLRVQCPGCQRKFEHHAAERHIPKCVEKQQRGR